MANLCDQLWPSHICGANLTVRSAIFRRQLQLSSGIRDLGSGIRDLASVIWNQWSVGRGWFLAHFGCTIQVQWNGFRTHPDDLSRWRCGVLCFISAVTMRDTDNVTFAWVATCDIKTLKGILLSAKTVAFADTCERADPAPSRDPPLPTSPPLLAIYGTYLTALLAAISKGKAPIYLIVVQVIAKWQRHPYSFSELLIVGN